MDRVFQLNLTCILRTVIYSRTKLCLAHLLHCLVCELQSLDAVLPIVVVHLHPKRGSACNPSLA